MSICVTPQDVLDSKNSAIKDLQYELARVCKVSLSQDTTSYYVFKMFHIFIFLHSLLLLGRLDSSYL